MNGRGVALALVSLLSPALLLATRLPAEQAATGIVALALAAATVVAGLLAAARPASGWTAPLALALGIALVAVPASREAALAGLPAPLAAVAILLLFHLLYPLDATATPRLAGNGGRGLRAVRRLVPFAILLGLLAAFPWLAHQLLPERLAATREVTGALAPLVAALLAMVALATLALVRTLLTALRRGQRQPEAEPAPSTSPEASP